MASSPPERLTSDDLVLPAVVLSLVLAGLVGLRALGFGTSSIPPTEVEPVAGPTEAVDCASCHEEQVAAWRGSNHELAQTPIGPEHQGTDAPSFTYRGREVPVVGRLGVEPLAQWLVDVGDGRVQVSQVARHTPTGELFDVFGDERQPGEWGHWTGGGMTWNRSCASCHATEVRKGFDGTGYDTTFAEAGVGCAACHGDASSHGAGQGEPPHDGAGVDTCAPCHARRAELTDGWTAGAELLDGFAPVLVDGTEGGLFYPDGQVRDEVFEWTAFASSRMHEAGVTCVSCHDPHSGQLVRDGDALCLGCHETMEGFEPHDLHEDPVTCVGCHMPVTTYMERDPRHDHGFRRPDPVTGQALGIPDACGRCHAERDNVAVAIEAYGAKEVDPRARAFAEGDARSLLAILSDEGQPPLWRASAAARAGADPDAVPTLRRFLEDADPLVRFGVWTGLAPWLGPDDAGRGLSDPSRAVRVAAARAQAPMLPRDDPRAADYRAYLAHNADQPDALVEDASWAAARGDLAVAEDRLRQALRLDPQRLSALDGLAVVASMLRRGPEAVEALERAVALAPQDGTLWARLGLARAAVGDVGGAEAALTEGATRGAPRAAYNLGLLLAEQGAYEDALRHLFAAEEAEDGADVRYAIASTLWAWGRRDQARIAAKRVLQLEPDHAAARQLLAAP